MIVTLLLMIASTLVLYYLIFHAPLVQLIIKVKPLLKLPSEGVIHRTSHQSSPLLNVHALQVNKHGKKISNYLSQAPS